MNNIDRSNQEFFHQSYSENVLSSAIIWNTPNESISIGLKYIFCGTWKGFLLVNDEDFDSAYSIYLYIDYAIEWIGKDDLLDSASEWFKCISTMRFNRKKRINWMIYSVQLASDLNVYQLYDLIERKG